VALTLKIYQAETGEMVKRLLRRGEALWCGEILAKKK
jgi:hypothetical protein